MNLQKDTSWRDIYPSKFLSSNDLAEGKDTILTIEKIHVALVKGSGNKKDNMPIVTFRESGYKEMYLNIVNCKALESALGTEKMMEWQGRRVLLFTKVEDCFGEKKRVVRIRSTAAPTDNPKGIHLATASQLQILDSLFEKYQEVDRLQIYRIIKKCKNSKEFTQGQCDRIISHLNGQNKMEIPKEYLKSDIKNESLSTILDKIAGGETALILQTETAFTFTEAQKKIFDAATQSKDLLSDVEVSPEIFQQ